MHIIALLAMVIARVSDMYTLDHSMQDETIQRHFNDISLDDCFKNIFNQYALHS